MRKMSWLFAALLFAALPATAQNNKPLDPNAATEAQLASMPHLNSALVQAIVAKRPLASPTAFDAVLAAGNLSPEQRKQLFTVLWVPMNLNTATPADIMLIPGMSARMMNEFREYRPYRAIGQFRAEIGKYVKKEEVARLERYVFVPQK